MKQDKVACPFNLGFLVSGAVIPQSLMNDTHSGPWMRSILLPSSSFSNRSAKPSYLCLPIVSCFRQPQPRTLPSVILLSSHKLPSRFVSFWSCKPRRYNDSFDLHECIGRIEPLNNATPITVSKTFKFH